MKVVLLAGGFGTRISEESGTRPKPMVEIGGRPILWHIMKHYAAHGFDDFLKPLFAENCEKCHGGEKVKGKVNLKEITSTESFLSKPKLIKELIEVVDAYDMPPEDEPELEEGDRTRLLASLKSMLARSAAASDGETARVQIRRLNRFQYNNTIRDLFQPPVIYQLHFRFKFCKLLGAGNVHLHSFFLMQL